MAYEPVRASAKGPNVSVEDDVSSIRYDAGSYSNDSDNARDRNTEDGVEETKGNSNGMQVQRWPLNSQKVAVMTPLKVLILVFDVVLASTPVMFLALALIAVRLDGTEVSDYGHGLEQTLLLSPTIFPLIFAALMGRFFRHLGLWLAQRGTTLGRLEQLIGCQSVFSALERQFCLRSWSLVGLASVLIWLLSPVGGQSALRLLNQEIGDIRSTSQVRYMSPMTIMDSMMSGYNFVEGGRNTYTPITLAAILSSTRYQNTPMDLWGNVKLPLYRSIENSTPDEWKLVPNSTASNVTYASLIGIPVVGPPSVGVSSFNIAARQWDLTCSSNEGPRDKPADFTDEFSWQLQIFNDTQPPCKKNDTACPTPWCTGYPCPIRSESVAQDKEDKFSVSDCELSFGKYEVGVRCNGTACSVYKMRKVDLLDEDFPVGYDIAVRRLFTTNLLSVMPSLDFYKTTSLRYNKGSTTMEKWISDPSNFIGLGFVNVELYKLSPQVLGERLTILYNTFWQSTYGTRALGGSLPASVMETGWLNTSQTTDSVSSVKFDATEADVLKNTRPAYRTNWKWLTALLICSVVLLAAAYSGLVLKYITLVPDIIGYASSLTLLNPYFPTPTGGTTLNGLDRTALLRDFPVRIGDVCPDEEVGAIAFARADIGNVGRLDRKRWYI
ncbi:hypothetical protein G6011_05890 [Alternaria panax]|uniref:Uncharacterized protein n=1 Tax=Alternaria panax TaxID=48097 RepID=A0AAD4FFB8_9PLEO|nr:hypothetical protein G6011_05890 [Alternaria panax]